jgi:hypothetical protein
MTATRYPVHVGARLDPNPGRWQWLVKWLPLVPREHSSAERPRAATAPPPGLADTDRVTVGLGVLLAALAACSSAAGLLVHGGPGRHGATTARSAEVTLYGDGLYAADTWLIGAGSRGQDVAVLLFEVPVLLTVLGWVRRRPAAPLASVALSGVLAFFAYYYLSMVFGTAQNRLFPAYVVAASVSLFALARTVASLDAAALARELPTSPSRRTLVGYLVAVAAALTAAWAPSMLGAALSGDIADHVGPYTSSATEALDLGGVVPVALVAAALVRQGRALGIAMSLGLLVLNVCIGVVLLAQGASQVLSGVPLTTGEIVGKSLAFLGLTVVAGGLLGRIHVRSRVDARKST